MSTPFVIFLTILFVTMFASYKANKLTLPGTLTGGVVAVAIYGGAGFTGILMLGMFFLLSVWATSHKKADKRDFTDKTNDQKRNAGQVLANGGAAAVSGLLAWLIPSHSVLFIVLMAAALASATADTLSSELGNVYGKRFYNIINFKPDEKGRDGVISLEGTLIGIAGSTIIALIYTNTFGATSALWYIIIAGTTGNISDSVLGATLERRGYINNNTVNFINTLVAALTGWLLMIT